jgi:hypothetical protein
MISFKPEHLQAILSMRTANGWYKLVEMIKELRDLHTENWIHYIPDPADFNSRDRLNVMRGIAICLDIMHHAFADPQLLLEDVKTIEESAQKMNESNPF